MKDKYCLLLIIFLGFGYVVNASDTTFDEKQLPYNTIEEAVRASGGTYGVIDTSDPDAANNFVDTVFENGLTSADDDGDCTSMNIRPSIKFSCALGGNGDAYYYYQGQKGEKVTVTVSANNFVPEIYITDANGGVEFFVNEAKQKSLTVVKNLPYTGEYIFSIRTRYYAETDAGEPFTIILTSDKTNIQPDIRKDNLVQNKKYSIYELNQNQSTTARRFLVDAYVVSIYKEPECPKDAYSCPISLSPNITISDYCGPVGLNNCLDHPDKKGIDTTLWLKEEKYDFEIWKQYQFEVYVINTSKTNDPKNIFELISVKDMYGKDITISTSTRSVVQDYSPAKRSFFTRFINWFELLF